MSVCKYDTTLLFLIESHSTQLPLHRPEIRLNQTFFLLDFENRDLKAISHLLVGILAQPFVLILIVFNTSEFNTKVSCSFNNLIDVHDAALLVWGFFQLYAVLCVYLYMGTWFPI